MEKATRVWVVLQQAAHVHVGPMGRMETHTEVWCRRAYLDEGEAREAARDANRRGAQCHVVPCWVEGVGDE